MATVAVTKITVSSTDVRLRAAVSVVDPIINVSRSIPVSEISYIYLLVLASLDSTGLFKFVTDSAVVSDGNSYSFAKSPADTISFSDFQFRDTSLGKSESVSLSDILSTLLVFIRLFEETISLSDAAAKSINKVSSDSLAAGDSLAFTFTKSLSDSFALNDLSDVNGTTISFSDFTNNVVSSSDLLLFLNSKVIQDTLSPSDSGYLFSQGYCDLTYFAEDYVGDYRTF
jgi:hypothetical protein